MTVYYLGEGYHEVMNPAEGMAHDLVQKEFDGLLLGKRMTILCLPLTPLTPETITLYAHPAAQSDWTSHLI
jgi:hypothetical protein